MKNVLVDSSVWIDYFRSGRQSADLDDLINHNLIVINELILTELTPALALKKQNTLTKLLHHVRMTPLNINWVELAETQTKCLKKGANCIGIPDLIIAQNAKHNDVQIYSLDKHFRLINQVYKLQLYQPVK